MFGTDSFLQNNKCDGHEAANRVFKVVCNRWYSRRFAEIRAKQLQLPLRYYFFS